MLSSFPISPRSSAGRQEMKSCRPARPERSDRAPDRSPCRRSGAAARHTGRGYADPARRSGRRSTSSVRVEPEDDARIDRSLRNQGEGCGVDRHGASCQEKESRAIETAATIERDGTLSHEFARKKVLTLSPRSRRGPPWGDVGIRPSLDPGPRSPLLRHGLPPGPGGLVRAALSGRDLLAVIRRLGKSIGTSFSDAPGVRHSFIAPDRLMKARWTSSPEGIPGGRATIARGTEESARPRPMRAGSFDCPTLTRRSRLQSFRRLRAEPPLARFRRRGALRVRMGHDLRTDYGHSPARPVLPPGRWTAEGRRSWPSRPRPPRRFGRTSSSFSPREPRVFVAWSTGRSVSRRPQWFGRDQSVSS